MAPSSPQLLDRRFFTRASVTTAGTLGATEGGTVSSPTRSQRVTYEAYRASHAPVHDGPLQPPRDALAPRGPRVSLRTTTTARARARTRTNDCLSMLTARPAPRAPAASTTDDGGASTTDDDKNKSYFQGMLNAPDRSFSFAISNSVGRGDDQLQTCCTLPNTGWTGSILVPRTGSTRSTN